MRWVELKDITSHKCHPVSGTRTHQIAPPLRKCKVPRGINSQPTFPKIAVGRCSASLPPKKDRGRPSEKPHWVGPHSQTRRLFPTAPENHPPIRQNPTLTYTPSLSSRAVTPHRSAGIATQASHRRVVAKHRAQKSEDGATQSIT